MMADLVEEINSLLRNEKNSKTKLKEIPESFFKNADNELKRLKEELRISIEKNQIEYMTQLKFKINVIQNGIKELKRMRANKIALIAIEDAINETKSEMTNFIPEERILYEELKRSFEFYVTGNNTPLPVNEIVEKAHEKNIEKKEENETIETKVTVRILIPIDVADLDRNYNLRKEDIVTVSEDLAKALFKKGMCEIISLPENNN